MPTLFLMLALLAGNATASHWSRAEYAGVLTDPELSEVSGLAASRVHPGVYWAQNDGGNPERIIAIRPDGTRIASLRVQDVHNTDWEDIDSFDLDGKHYLMLADTGDNGGIRKTLLLHFIEEPAQLKDGASLKPAWSIEFRWPDGARDCEATAVDVSNGQVLLISKKRVPPEVFALPLHPAADAGVLVAQPIALLPGIAQPSIEDLKQNPVYGRYRSQVSGADLSPNGRVLAVLNYHSIHLYVREPGQTWAQALDKAVPDELPLPWLPQAEGIAFSLDGKSLLIGSEQRPSPVLRFRILR
jgi:hypothetical protein